MDTGGPDVGGHNANVLMLPHIPADGSRTTVISIPRDDYVDLAGTPVEQALDDGLKAEAGTGLMFPYQTLPDDCTIKVPPGAVTTNVRGPLTRQ